MSMIELKPSQFNIDQAHKRVEKAKLYKVETRLERFGSDWERTFYGYLMEELIKDWLKSKKVLISETEEYDYDIVIWGKRFDAKTIITNVLPRLNYLGTVNSCDLNGVHKQQSDYFLFCRILKDMSWGWIVSYFPCKDFWEQGIFHKKDEEVYEGKSFTKANSTTLEYRKMYPATMLETYIDKYLESLKPKPKQQPTQGRLL